MINFSTQALGAANELLPARRLAAFEPLRSSAALFQVLANADVPKATNIGLLREVAPACSVDHLSEKIVVRTFQLLYRLTQHTQRTICRSNKILVLHVPSIQQRRVPYCFTGDRERNRELAPGLGTRGSVRSRAASPAGYDFEILRS
jgi:hypothetical protein